MTESLDETKSNFVEGISVSPSEMQAQFGIPPEEFASFRDITRIYPGGEILIKECDQERALYLLRAGRVEVFKGFGAARESMGTIDAVNFFGEMSMINDEPRSATVQALSERVVVYRIPNPNIHTILTNPLWAELLISRLARNLAEHVEQHLVASKQVKELQAEVARLTAALASRYAGITCSFGPASWRARRGCVPQSSAFSESMNVLGQAGRSAELRTNLLAVFVLTKFSAARLASFMDLKCSTKAGGGGALLNRH